MKIRLCSGAGRGRKGGRREGWKEAGNKHPGAWGRCCQRKGSHGAPSTLCLLRQVGGQGLGAPQNAALASQELVLAVAAAAGDILSSEPRFLGTPSLFCMCRGRAGCVRCREHLPGCESPGDKSVMSPGLILAPRWAPQSGNWAPQSVIAL